MFPKKPNVHIEFRSPITWTLHDSTTASLVLVCLVVDEGEISPGVISPKNFDHLFGDRLVLWQVLDTMAIGLTNAEKKTLSPKKNWHSNLITQVPRTSRFSSFSDNNTARKRWWLFYCWMEVSLEGISSADLKWLFRYSSASVHYCRWDVEWHHLIAFR